LMRKGQ